MAAEDAPRATNGGRGIPQHGGSSWVTTICDLVTRCSSSGTDAPADQEQEHDIVIERLLVILQEVVDQEVHRST